MPTFSSRSRVVFLSYKRHTSQKNSDGTISWRKDASSHPCTPTVTFSTLLDIAQSAPTSGCQDRVPSPWPACRRASPAPCHARPAHCSTQRPIALLPTSGVYAPLLWHG